jgi:hypothetical protein
MATAETKAIATNERTAASLAEIPEETLVKRYGMTRAEVEAVKKALAPDGTTDFEILLYLGVCKRLELDPFVPGLVHFMRFQNREKTGYRTGIVLGVYGYLQMAQQQQDCDGLQVQCFPEDPEKPPTHAKCTVWKKSWSHPLEVTVAYKEKNRAAVSPFWRESPRQALETAAIRRACRLAWPALFAPMEDEDVDDNGIPPAARGNVGTVLGEHHDTPPLVDVEAKVVAPLPAPETPPPAPEAPPLSAPGPSKADVEHVASEVRDLMDDPLVKGNRELRKRTDDLLNSRLDAMKLDSIWQAKPENLEALEALRDDLQRLVGGN